MKTDEPIYFCVISVSKRLILSGVNVNASLTAQQWPGESADVGRMEEYLLSPLYFLITVTTDDT